MISRNESSNNYINLSKISIDSQSISNQSISIIISQNCCYDIMILLLMKHRRSYSIRDGPPTFILPLAYFRLHLFMFTRLDRWASLTLDFLIQSIIIHHTIEPISVAFTFLTVISSISTSL